MAPIPQSNTARLWVRYTSGPFEHELLFRAVDAPTPAQMIARVDGVITALQSLMAPTDSFIGARFANAGQDFSLPVAFGPYPGLGSASLSSGDPESHYVDFIGRGSITGRRARWNFFTQSQSAPIVADNRYDPGEVPAVDAVIAALADATFGNEDGPGITTIGGDAPNIYNYANSGWNYHWLREQRG